MAVDEPKDEAPLEHWEAPGELPPVETPSAGLVVQLFIIPLVIVAVLVIGGILVYLPFGRLAGSEQAAVDYVPPFAPKPPAARGSARRSNWQRSSTMNQSSPRALPSWAN